MKLWRLRYGNESEIEDYTGKWIKKDHYEGVELVVIMFEISII
ncbi:hypothetical protein RRG54_01355 [Mycoplasmopsis felis]|nr:hypothetical protein [Mycoplasmopsis felis]WQQ11924.1 hypothetical protein RRG50_01560 [Mycoplasmopsis felis]WRX06823.1 hypothetical protein O7984_00980 [Mycoplasmopsis felis]